MKRKLSLTVYCYCNATGEDGVTRGTRCVIFLQDVEAEVLPMDASVTLDGKDTPRPTGEIQIATDKGYCSRAPR